MASGAKTQLTKLIDLRHSAGELSLFSRSKALSALVGSVKTNFRGRGLDFEEIRQYQAGDDIRSIDWRVTARTGVAHTKLYQEERERPVLVAVDQRSSMAFGSQCCFKSVQAAEVASLISWAALAKNDRVGGLIFNDSLHHDVRPARSKSAVLKIISAIDSFNKGNSVDSHGRSSSSTNKASQNSQQINDVIIELRRIAKPGSAIFIVSDFIGLDDEGIKQLHLLKKHCDIHAIFISDPMERQLPASGGNQFTDGINRSRFDISDKKLLNGFAQRFDSRLTALTQQLSANGIPTIAISTNDDAIQIMRRHYHENDRSKARGRSAARASSASL